MKLNFYKIKIDDLQIMVCEYIYQLIFMNTSIVVSKAMIADHTSQINGDTIDMDIKAEYYVINFENIKTINLLGMYVLEANREWNRKDLIQNP